MFCHLKSRVSELRNTPAQGFFLIKSSSSASSSEQAVKELHLQLQNPAWKSFCSVFFRMATDHSKFIE